MFEKLPGELITLNDEAWLFPVSGVGGKCFLVKPPTSMIVLNDAGSVRLWLECGHIYVRRIEVLSSKGHGWVYLAPNGKFVK